MIEFTTKDIERLWDKVDKNGPYSKELSSNCWIWTGAWGGSGKPFFFSGKHNGRKLLHGGKVVREVVTGNPVGKTRKFFHLCGNHRCVNPAHTLPDTLENRFNYLVDKNGPTQEHMDTPCWKWKGYVTPSGYGKLSYRNKNLPAHRASMILAHGEIPDGKIVCHHCDNPPCTNPSHLYFGTGSDNAADNINRGRGYTVRGEMVGNSRLTAADIIDIRQRVVSGETQSSIAKEYGVDPSHISNIINRKNWKHI